MSKVKILGIVGSLRKDSNNHFALKAAHELAPNDVALDPIELHDKPTKQFETLGYIGTTCKNMHIEQNLGILRFVKSNASDEN